MLRHEPPGSPFRGSPVSVATTWQPASAAAVLLGPEVRELRRRTPVVAHEPVVEAAVRCR
jgi:hypothetical protein